LCFWSSDGLSWALAAFHICPPNLFELLANKNYLSDYTPSNNRSTLTQASGSGWKTDFTLREFVFFEGLVIY